MELSDVVIDERPGYIKKVKSVYKLSDAEIKAIRDFEEIRLLSVSHMMSSQNLEDFWKSMVMIDKSPKAAEIVIKEIFLSQEFEYYQPNHNSSDRPTLVLYGPKLELPELNDEEYNEDVHFLPSFEIEYGRTGFLEVNSSLEMKDDMRYGSENSYFAPLLADAYNALYKGRMGGRENPEVFFHAGGFLDIAEARLVRKAFDLIQEICRKHPLLIERARDFADLRCKIYSEKKEHIAKALRYGYDRLIEETLGIK